MSDHDRFWKRVAETVMPAEWTAETPPTSPCLEWTGYRDVEGYGIFRPSGKNPRQAHIFAYDEWYGPPPEGYDRDHLCRNPPCVNPEHLEAVPHEENLRRGVGHSNMTHCRNGHALVEGNVQWTKGNKQRLCLTCKRASVERYRLGQTRPRNGTVDVCERGHDISLGSPNLRVYGNGRRRCHRCELDKQNERRAKKRAAI